MQEDYLLNIQIVADLSYAWEIIDNYTAFMQDGIKNDPFIVTKLRATFLKLASALDIPLVSACKTTKKNPSPFSLACSNAYFPAL